MSADATAARFAELEAENARLRRLLDERNAPSELRHRLRNAAGMLRCEPGATTQLDFEGDGLRCTISPPRETGRFAPAT